MRIKRSRRGMSTVALIMVLAFFVVLPLGLLGFEFARYTLLASQLQSVTDSATLAGTAALASSPPGYSYTDLHNLAMDVAVQTFQQNSVLQTPFSAANVVANKNTGIPLGTPPLHKAHLNITLLNQAGTPVATGSNTAVTMRVASIYSDAPIFASSLLKIGAIETASAVSDGGLPQLDLILCFDVSGSMDDQTKVALVKRFWNPGLDTVDYQVQSSNKSIYDTFGPPKTGTGLNALPPQNLFKGSYPGATGNATPYAFSEGIYPPANLAAGLRGNQKAYAAGSIPGLPLATKYPAGALVAEQGWPPGNFDPTNRLNPTGNGVNPNAQPTCYTDLVVKVPSVGPYDFSKIETCVEASRGNMESDAICLQSQGHVNINSALPPRQPGYYAAYWSQVEKTADPIAAARAAANNFFYTMNIASNAHFGICTFSDAAGTSPTSFWPDTNSKCDPSWPHSGTASFPVPLISLNKTQSNFAEVNDAVDGTATTLPLRPTGKTCISLSLHEAITELIDPAKFRPKAKKAIVLFTDGVPNLPGVGATAEATAKAAAFSEADWAKSKSIPIYTIGLSQNAAIKPFEDAVLGDSAAKPGIAYRSGNNAIYVSVTNSADLNSAFQTIARSLVVLQ
ncbi:VWA domain-containing protein [bacterium]|nr:VWA domain-containing protein [bacterium]MBP9809718.1 VWA domain-containing protein [bacterium]